MTPDERLTFNGVNGAGGGYLEEAAAAEALVALATGVRADARHQEELEATHRRRTEATYSAAEGVDPTDVGQAGWGVIFARDADPAFREALEPLLALRRSETPHYREYVGDDGYAGESKVDFLARHGVGIGPVDPRRMPYYLLLVGDPETLPYTFQYQLDVTHCVGRLDIGTPEDAARYAETVVAAARGELAAPRRVALFGPRNADDPSTHASADHLLTPLAADLRDVSGWEVEATIGADATKARLLDALGGATTPALLVTASHGLGFPATDQRLEPHGGALLCQEWPGPKAHAGAIPQEMYLAADDVADDAHLEGLVTFHYACYGGGTPRYEYFARPGAAAPRQLAPRGFVARLPQRLLGHPRGGALACIGQVDRAWACSFLWRNAGVQGEVFRSTLRRLLCGHPVGHAMDHFGQRYAAIATELAALLEQTRWGKRVDARELAGMWTATNDARSWVVLGDPAVRLPVAGTRRAAPERPTIELRGPQPAPTAPAEPPPATPARTPRDILGELADTLRTAARRADELRDALDAPDDRGG